MEILDFESSFHEINASKVYCCALARQSKDCRAVARCYVFVRQLKDSRATAWNYVPDELIPLSSYLWTSTIPVPSSRTNTDPETLALASPSLRVTNCFFYIRFWQVFWALACLHTSVFKLMWFVVEVAQYVGWRCLSMVFVLALRIHSFGVIILALACLRFKRIQHRLMICCEIFSAGSIVSYSGPYPYHLTM